jgi:hypothetical protein
VGYDFEKKKLFHLLGEDLYDLLKRYEAIIAGGMITSLFCNREINDIDVYFRNEDSIIDFLCEVWEDQKWVAIQTKKATLLVYDDIKLQLIHFNYFETPQDIFKTFDFTVCMGAFDFKTEEFVLHDDFLKHNSQRILKFNSSTTFPIVSLLRVQKYQEKGYTISKPEFLRIVLSCMNLNIDSFDELKDQLGGMYGVNYDKLFEEFEDEEFDLQTAIDKITDLSFNDEYFEKPSPIEFGDLDDLIENISTKPVRYFKHKDQVYKINYQGILVKSDQAPENGIEIMSEEYFNSNKFYKFVEKRGDRYFSFFDPNFEYKLGEVVEAKGESLYHWDAHRGNLHFSELKDLKSSTYVNRSNAVVIEVEINVSDFTGLDGHIMAKRCKVLREVPKEEYERYL